MKYKYKAFISYSHKDEKFAKWLHKKLESYKIHKELYAEHTNLPKKIFPIFRDVEELSASSDLPKEILEALGDAEYLIVICSPHATQSKWVNQEIVDFKLIHGEERVLSIILEGEPHAKENDKLDSRLECFPEALKYRVKSGKVSKEKAEPIAADVRGRWRSEWEFGKLKLISGLLELDFEELNKREEKRRRKSRFIWGVVSLLIIASLSGLAWYSFVQKEKAELSLENNLFQQGLVYKNYLDNPMYAKVFFSEVLKRTKTKEKSTKIVYNTIDTNVKINNILSDEYLFKYLSLVKKKYSLYSLINKEVLSKYLTGYHNIFWKTKILKNKNFLLSWSYDQRRIKLWDLKTKKEKFSFRYIPLLEGMTFNFNESMIALWSKQEIVILDTKNGNVISTMTYKKDVRVESVVFSRDSKNIISCVDDKATLWNIKNAKEEYSISGGLFGFFNGVVFTPDNRYIISYGYNGEIIFWHKETGIAIKRISYSSPIMGVDIDFNGKYLLVWHNKSLELIDIKSRKKVLESFNQKERVEKAFFSEDGKYIFSFSSSGDIYILNRSTMKQVEYIKVSDGLLNVVYDSRNKFLYTKDLFGIREWKILNNKRIKHFKRELNLCCFNSKRSKKYFINWEDEELKILDINQNFKMNQFEHDSEILEVEFTNNADEFLIMDDKKILLWSQKTDESRVLLSAENNFFTELLSFDSGRLFMVRYEITENNLKSEHIQIYNIETKEKLFGMVSDKTTAFQGLGIQNNILNKNIVFTINNHVLLWNKKDKVKQFTSNYLKSIEGKVFSEDERYLFLWESDKVVVWDRSEEKEKLIWLDKNLHSNQKIEEVILDEESQSIFIVYSNFIRVLDSKNYKEKSLLNQLSSEEISMQVCFTKDKKQVMVWSNKNIKLWDIATKKILLDINPIPDSEVRMVDIIKVFFNKNEEKIISILDNGEIIEYSIFTNRQIINKYYSLKTQVETGYYLTLLGEIKTLSIKEWKKKKAQYEKILMKTNGERGK